jgi:DNA-binding response OmpR family regulator
MDEHGAALMKNILFADNDPDFLNTRAEFLENAGYRVLKAYTLEQARQLLAEARVHLAILDIRMEDDDDERDTSGLTLAKDPAYRPVPKIILTGFPTHQAVREALGPALDGLPPAVYFLSKQEGPEAMIQAVEWAFTQHVRINWDLPIHWDQRERLSFLHLASLLQPDLPNDILVHRADELEDLVRRLFYDYRQMRVGRRLWHDGWRFCLPVLAQSPQGATDPRILVCGERERLNQELRRMRELAPETIQGTKLVSAKETMHFGAAAYALPDADMETVQPLRELFQSGRERDLKAAFNHLLKEVLVAWHQRGQMLEEACDLMALYRRWVGLEENGLSRTEVERRVEALVQIVRPLSAVGIERSNGLVTFHFPNMRPLACPDPVATIYAPLEQYSSSVVCRVSPGQLTADNVLVDAGRRTWLTDFAYAGQAPQWWDFVCLEAIIRFDLSQAPDLSAWQDFEKCLVTPASLHDRLRVQDVIPDLETSVALTEQIRRQAGFEAGPDPLPYYAGLLAWAVGAMARYDPTVLYTRDERMRGAHLLLAAAMLARRLSETLPIVPPGGVLRLDDEGVVWIGDHRIPLVGQELDLLRCLYEQKGKPVNRKTIVESVFKEQYSPGDEQMESRINSLVKRLRDKIEPNPDRPRYLLTTRGGGYHLQVGEEPDG